MVRLLRKPKRPRLSKADAAGAAATTLRLHGSLTIPLAADYLQVHKYTVREFIGKGFIRSIQVGSIHRVSEDELRRVKQLLGEHGSLAKAFKAIQQVNGANTD